MNLITTPKISVLMSVYNESFNEINEAINSILNQTFTRLEFIIVNDNPKRRDLGKFLTEIKRKDQRIKIINNQVNIGLALSMNKALKIAEAPYIARMDADDISLENRMSIQYSFIKNNSYDLVCSSYGFLNEDNKIIDRNVKVYQSDEIIKKLPFGNIIHHPTVMIKKKSLLKVNGYRNFHCAQDYDLWLRLLDRNMTFYMLSDKLLMYRIRQTSVSSMKRNEQIYTSNYIRNLYVQRIRNNQDDYTYASYKKYLQRKIKGTSINKMNNDYTTLIKSHRYYEEKKYLRAFIMRMKIFIMNRAYRENYLSKLRAKVFIKLSKI